MFILHTFQNSKVTLFHDQNNDQDIIGEYSFTIPLELFEKIILTAKQDYAEVIINRFLDGFEIIRFINDTNILESSDTDLLIFIIGFALEMDLEIKIESCGGSVFWPIHDYCHALEGDHHLLLSSGRFDDWLERDRLEKAIEECQKISGINMVDLCREFSTIGPLFKERFGEEF